MSNEVVIILSHADTTDKLEVLNQCVNAVKNQGYDVILSSHIKVPDIYYELVDFVIYDKDNPIIFYSEFPGAATIFVWSQTEQYSQVYPFEFNHAYAVLKLIKNGIGVAYANGYEKAHFVNYDYVINNKELLERHSSSLDNNDLYSYYFDYFDNTRKHLNAGLFSARVKPFLEASLFIKDKYDFSKKKEGIFEKFLYSYYHEECGLTLECVDQIIMSHGNIINSKSTFKNVIDGKMSCYLAYESATDSYYASIKKLENIDIDVTININNENFTFNPTPNLQYVIDITDFIKNHDNIIIKIPQLGFTDTYNTGTHHATCEVFDRSIINKLDEICARKKRYTIEEYCDDNKIKRWDIINFLANNYGARDYLEIGVNDGSCIRKIQIPNRDGVDPSPASEVGGNMIVPEINYQFTSDYFFENYAHKNYDIIFIDGLHHSEQVDRDIENSLKHLNDGGFIILHDCNPPIFEMQIVPRQMMLWNGDVWKSIVKLRCSNPELEVSVIDTDWGIGVVRKGSQEIYNKESLDTCLEWNYFDDNRDEILNIISVQDFYNKHKQF